MAQVVWIKQGIWNSLGIEGSSVEKVYCFCWWGKVYIKLQYIFEPIVILPDSNVHI